VTRHCVQIETANPIRIPLAKTQRTQRTPSFYLISFNNFASLAVLGALARTLLFLFFGYAVYAQERPVRNIAPDPSLLNIQSNYVTDTPSFVPAPNSLLTQNALNQQLTRHYIEYYTSPRGVTALNAIMERSKLYIHFIKDEVEARGLPPELAYLPIIESGFQITARSRSGAMGLWQFMLNSISPYNIRVSDLIDERRDFVKSTKGALQKLEDEYRSLGCWELTLAAYNSGLGAVTRIVRRTGKNDYWELSARRELRQETINFVPRLIAAAYVVSQPRRFGINTWQERFEWTDIPLSRQVSLDVIAEETGLDRNILRSLNAELVYGISPIDGNYRLKVPTGYLEQINEVLQREDLRLIRYHYHIVRSGDTLWSMSRHYGTPLNMIEQHNPGISARVLRLGETVIIPAFPDGSPAQRVTTAPTAAQRPGFHVVQRGDTFWSLGRRYGIEPGALAQSNNMQLSDTLHEGRTLRVPIIE